MTGRQGGRRSVHLPIIAAIAAEEIPITPELREVPETSSAIVIWQNLFRDNKFILSTLERLGEKPGEVHGDLFMARSALKRMLGAVDKLIAIEEGDHPNK